MAFKFVLENGNFVLENNISLAVGTMLIPKRRIVNVLFKKW